MLIRKGNLELECNVFEDTEPVKARDIQKILFVIWSRKTKERLRAGREYLPSPDRS